MPSSSEPVVIQIPSSFMRFLGAIKNRGLQHPKLAVLAGLFLYAFLSKNHLLQPLITFSAFVSVAFFIIRSSASSPKAENTNSGNVPITSPAGASAETFAKSSEPVPFLVEWLKQIEQKISTSPNSVPQTNVPIEKLSENKVALKKPRNLLAWMLFLVGLLSFLIPSSLIGIVLISKYLNRSELSSVFLDAFNELSLDQLLYQIRFADFDFFATFFGLFLIPLGSLLLFAFFISVRILLKRQKGFFLAITSVFMLSIASISTVGLWKCLVFTANLWHNEIYTEAEPSVEHYQQVLHSQDTFFLQRIIAVKALKKINTPEAYQALFSCLTGNNAVIQQLILGNLEGHFSREQFPQIENLLQNNSNPRFQELGVTLISTLPDKDITYKLLDSGFSFSPKVLAQRFTSEDFPTLQNKLAKSPIQNKSILLQVLYQLDPIQSLKILEEWVLSSEEEQYAVLTLIETYLNEKMLIPLLQELENSEFTSIQKQAHSLWKKISRSKKSKYSQKVKSAPSEYSCNEE